MINKKRLAVVGFFIIVLALGLSIYKDYGVHWDEVQNQDSGRHWLSYIDKAAARKDLFYPRFIAERPHEWVHGPAVEIFLSAVQTKLLNVSDSREAIFLRHLLTFLIFFLGLIFFYRLCAALFNDWRIGLLGCVLLILNPRIFSHSFYNSVDIPFLSFFIIGIYTLIRMLGLKTYRKVIIHSLVCAILIDIRIAGIILVIYTLIFLLIDTLKNRKERPRLERNIISILLYLGATCVFMVVFWPLLWSDPLHNFFEALHRAKEVSWNWEVLYLGNLTKATELPWHYGPVWIAITTPLALSGCFLIGLALSIRKRKNLIPLLWFFLPLLAVIGLKITLYDSWRHLFFLYPACIIIALYGAVALFRSLTHKAGRAVLAGILLLNMVTVGSFMVRNHPYENLYFNRLAGKDMAEIKGRFELDYWGLSYREALEYILATDSSPSIKVFCPHLVGEDSRLILPPDQRKRLTFTDNYYFADYFMGNFRWHKEDYPFDKEYFSKEAGNAKIVAVYKLP